MECVVNFDTAAVKGPRDICVLKKSAEIKVQKVLFLMSVNISSQC